MNESIPIDKRWEYRKVNGKWKRCLRPEEQTRRDRAARILRNSLRRIFQKIEGRGKDG